MGKAGRSGGALEAAEGILKRGVAWGGMGVWSLLAVLSLLLPLGALAAPDLGGEVPEDLTVPVRALLSTSGVVPGGETILAVTYDVPEDAHLQINDFLFAEPAEGEPFVLGPPLHPEAQRYEGESVFLGPTTVYYRLRADLGLETGRRTLIVKAGYQGCLEKPIFACFAPAEVDLQIPVEVLPVGSQPEPAHEALFASMPGPPPSVGADVLALGERPEPAGDEAGGADEAVLTEQSGLAGRLQAALARGSIIAFLLVFLGGVATSFTPCVYPMIPITISYIGGRSRSKLSAFFLSIFFVLGIALTYSSLGVLAATTGALFGGAMQSTPVLVGVAAIFFAMGASMLGAFDIALPAGMHNRLQGGPRAGVLGALFMGMVTGLVASPCVGPVVVVLLTWVAQIGSIGYGFLLLFVFALGLGMLFLVIGTFAGALSALPQAGGWMDTVKHFFGAVLIGMGIYYIRPLLGPDYTRLITGGYLVVVGTFLGAFRPVGEDPAKSILMRKGFGIILLLVGGLFLVSGTAQIAGIGFGGGAGPALKAEAGHEELDWVGDDVVGMEQARELGRPAFIDFYADWCAACVELDEKTWVDPEVRKEAERFVAIKLDLTRRSEWSQEKQAEYGVRGLPTVIFIDSFGLEVERFFGFRPPEDVLEIMKRID